eukprot:jgi/Mesen1/9205/ME000591S08531
MTAGSAPGNCGPLGARDAERREERAAGSSEKEEVEVEVEGGEGEKGRRDEEQQQQQQEQEQQEQEEEEEEGVEEWMATGAEDGALRVTRYSSARVQRLHSSRLLGDHVGGSAIRAICLAPASRPSPLASQGGALAGPPSGSCTSPGIRGPHLSGQEGQDVCVKKEEEKGEEEDEEGGRRISWLMFSAGAKEVLMCWLHTWTWALEGTPGGGASPLPGGSEAGGMGRGAGAPGDGCTDNKNQGPVRPTSGGQRRGQVAGEWQLSSQWLSTYKPRRRAKGAKSVSSVNWGRSNRGSEKELADATGAAALLARQGQEQEKREEEKEREKEVDDLRYLCVTAFTIGDLRRGTLVAYVAAASSDTSLSLLAYHASSSSWHVVARMQYHRSPVLSLDHVALAPGATSCSFAQGGALAPGAAEGSIHHWIVSGATDGSIAVWDVTEAVLRFDAASTALAAATSAAPARPITGRGSQGGSQRKAARWQGGGGSKQQLSKREKRKNLKSLQAPAVEHNTLATGGEPEGLPAGTGSSGKSALEIAPSGWETRANCGVGNAARQMSAASGEVPGELASTATWQAPPPLALVPAVTIAGAHQSGVNCLSASLMPCSCQAATVTGLQCPVQHAHVAHARRATGTVSTAGENLDVATSTSGGHDANGIAATDGGHEARPSNTLNGGSSSCSSSARLVVVSGGDDEAIHVATLVVRHITPTRQVAQAQAEQQLQQHVRFEVIDGGGEGRAAQLTAASEGGLREVGVLCQGTRVTPGAHSSALKGIWTDGSLVFSTGLDQRLICWQLADVGASAAQWAAEGSTSAPEEVPNAGRGSAARWRHLGPPDGHGGGQVALKEVARCIIDVPEAAELSVTRQLWSSRRTYHIAVVGRGVQVVKCNVECKGGPDKNSSQ